MPEIVYFLILGTWDVIFWNMEHFGRFWAQEWRKQQCHGKFSGNATDGVRHYKLTPSLEDNEAGKYHTWRSSEPFGELHLTASSVNGSRPSGVKLKRDGPERFVRDDVRKLNCTTRNPNSGVLTVSGIITWRRQPCNSIYSLWFFIH